MRKYALTLAAVLVTGLAFAQDLTSKKGEVILPEAGDWSIGIDATPVLEYVGGFFSETGASAAVFQPHSVIQGVPGNGSGFAIKGKYMVDAQTAYRAKVRVALNSTNDRTFVPDATDPDETVEDAFKTSEFGIVLGAGLEKRRGNTRLQGVYGAEAMLGFGSMKNTFEYGNDIEDSGESFRVTEEKMGSAVMFGVAGFIGVEYFVAPKVSCGGEYTWGVMVNSQGDGEVTAETFDGSDSDTTTSETAGGSSFSIDTGVFGSAALFLNMYF